MTNRGDPFLIRGRSSGKNGHPGEAWTASIRDLAYGRPANAATSSFKGRERLAEDVLRAFRQLTALPSPRSSFKNKYQHLTTFWRFLEEMDSVSRATGSDFPSPENVLEIPGVVWAFYKDWLDAQAVTTQHYSYFATKHIFDISASFYPPAEAARMGYPLPINPFPNPQKVAARIGKIEDKTLEPETLRGASSSLVSSVRATTERINAGRKCIDSTEDTRDDPACIFYKAAVACDWVLGGNVPNSHTFEAFQPIDDESRSNRNARRAHFFVPSIKDILPAFCLFLLRTGWNQSTALDMNSEDWARDHPTRPSQLVEIVSAKTRAAGKVQSAYSSRHKEAHPYQIIRAVLDWNQPLREGLKSAESKLRSLLLSDKMPPKEAEAIEREIRRLCGLQKLVWLHMGGHGEIVSLRSDMKYSFVNELFAKAGVQDRGRPLVFSQELSRTTWAMFAYQTSGYNALVTQIAMGHSDLSSLLHYLDQKSVRNRNRRVFFDFQTHVFTEISQGRLIPRVLRSLVEQGRLSKNEAMHLATGGTRSRQGIACANPFAPDTAVDPTHRLGESCSMQNCLDGCSKAFATLDCLEYVAARILELRLIQTKMPLFAWTNSDHPHDLQFLEQLFERFSEGNRKKAIEVAQRRFDPVIFTRPSAAALSRAR